MCRKTISRWWNTQEGEGMSGKQVEQERRGKRPCKGGVSQEAGHHTLLTSATILTLFRNVGVGDGQSLEYR